LTSGILEEIEVPAAFWAPTAKGTYLGGAALERSGDMQSAKSDEGLQRDVSILEVRGSSYDCSP
jgi:hypothetical protein